MSRHIVSTLQSMLIFRVILWHEAVEDSFHIHTHIRVCILINAQSATRMFAEDVDDARLRQLGQLSLVTKWKPRDFGFRVISIC